LKGIFHFTDGLCSVLVEHDFNAGGLGALLVYCTEAELAPYISIPPASMGWEFIANKTYIRVTSKFD
jgi:hypothetical protein